MLELTGLGGCDTAGVNENGLSYFEDYVLGATYEYFVLVRPDPGT